MEEQSLSQRLHIDFPLLSGIIILCLIGLVILYSAGGQDIDLVYRQAIKLSIALIGMIIVAQLPPAVLERWSLWLFIFGVVLLLLVIFFGDVGKGAQRWLDLGIFRFQPSEIMKLTVPMMVASYLADKSLPPKFSWVVIVCILITIPVLLIAKQPDLGTSLLVATAGFSVLFIAGISWRLLMSMGILAAAGAPILWYFMHDYQKQRVLTLLNPEQDPLGAGYHIIQSKIAIGSGGFYGKGWLNGTQSHLEFLPERSTDFIFAVFCEEFGMIGVLLLLCVYLFIISRGLYIAINAQNTYGRLLASGLTLTFFVYIFVNMGMVTGQLPVVGVPLPLISHGGTSMVTLMIGFGILMAIHTHRRFLSF
ncbi:MAG: rod shape-determining protein RodA [Proteobacteria bacterium]|nr:rod shape-determining protein RodA [Pseudomonadota bacterium]NOG60286.1 rod shape-determining protein RodA [Pseudomonadota bacterium]